MEWVVALCADVARTDVLACVQQSTLPDREYDGRVYVERIDMRRYLTPREIGLLIQGRVVARARHRVRTTLLSLQDVVLRGAFRLLTGIVRLLGFSKVLGPGLGNVKEGIRRAIWGDRPAAAALPTAVDSDDARRDDTEVRSASAGVPAAAAAILTPSNRDHSGQQSQHVAPARRERFRDVLRELYLVSRPLERRALASCLPPSAVVCNDLHGLLGARLLKRRFGCRIIYDTHELWPEAFRAHQRRWQKLCIGLLERRAIRDVDVVVAVTPQIADEYSRRYRPPAVLAVPNAEPWTDNPSPSFATPAQRPLRFLLQGQAAQGRGMRRLLRMWRELDSDVAMFVLRCIPNDFADELQREFSDLVERGRLEFPPPVTRLVEAASRADVGVIPYPGPSLNHAYACPNKLSQYMQAGLAILHNSDQVFVSDIVSQHACGLTFNLDDPDSLRSAVADLTGDAESLSAMQRRAYAAARDDFNWHEQSQPLRAAIRQAVVDAR